MKLSIFSTCKCWDQTAMLPHERRHEVVAPVSFRSFNLCEEYAGAFRTESYNEFWARVLELTFAKGSSTVSELKERSSGTTARLPSCRFFVDSLLDPDQATVAAVLAHARAKDYDTPGNNDAILSDYFAETANASLLCGLLLKDIEQVRLRCRSLKTALDSDNVGKHLADISNTTNPFSSHASSQQEFRSVQSASTSLLRRLDSHRNKARSKVRLAKNLRRSLAFFLVTVTASTSLLGVFMALHTILVLAALPLLLPRFHRAFSTRWLRRALARLDAAAKGAYILKRDLDTMSRLVVRLHDEVDHMLALMRFWSKQSGGERRPMDEVVRQLRKNEACFNRQLDELEEHLFLCFMTINKARSLVVKEILVP